MGIAADEVGLVHHFVPVANADAFAVPAVCGLSDAALCFDGVGNCVQRGGEFPAGTADGGAGVVVGDADFGAAIDLGTAARGVVPFLPGHRNHGVRVVHGAAVDFVAVALCLLFGGRLFLHPGDWVLLFVADEQCVDRVVADVVLQFAAAVWDHAGVLF